MKSFLGRILCRIGIHRWVRMGRWWNFDSDKIEIAFLCGRCNAMRSEKQNEDDGAIF